MKYPLRNEYDTAIRNLDKFLLDNTLKYGKPVKQSQNSNLLRSYNGGKAIVYEIQTSSKRYALKCWVEDLGDLKFRYKAIDDHLKHVNLPYFVEFSYQEHGIIVNGQKFPIVKMEWVDGINFKRFISNNISNSVHIRGLAEKFLDMVRNLHQKDISHGDLQHGNIMVRQNGDICLIDYDTMYVPKLCNERDNIKGLAGYQHSSRNKLDKLSPKVDYFSELVIYLSLLAISEQPSIWKKIEQEERLLFSEQDLLNPRSSAMFAELTKLSPEIIYFTLELEKFCRQLDIESLQPLEKLVDEYGGSKFTWAFESDTVPNLSSPSTNQKNSVWDFPATNISKSGSTVHASNSDPWNAIGVNLSNVWDKLDEAQPKVEAWDKLGKVEHREEHSPVESDSIWNKFDTIWNRLRTSISSAWNRFLNWLS